MGLSLLYCLRLGPTFSSASFKGRNEFSFRHPCLKRLLVDSMKALSVALPGRLKSSSTPFR